MTSSKCFIFSLLLSSLAPHAAAATLDHTFHLMLQHSSGASLAIPPKIHGLTVDSPTLSAGGPLYEGQTVEHTNPLYEPSAAPGTPGSVISVAFTFAKTQSLHAQGIVHRDIAARNLLITTEEGVYEAGADQLFYFSNDGPADLRGVGPVRWMAPESIRTKTYSGAPTAGPIAASAPTGYWELSAFSYFDVSYPVPSPGAASLLLVPALICLRRARVG